MTDRAYTPPTTPVCRLFVRPTRGYADICWTCQHHESEHALYPRVSACTGDASCVCEYHP